ncbi:hypothetical protein GCM10007938_16130 [Vibrio zhanjiangensis]|uniref:Uncharacterized protein n=1 Tax=Vibrio zhanjiangensis TaxID=1046128 RepID=A0ABQ6EZ28_9VIBR|nr:hypothetical protein [Vibrio zhanjiangensis]GLT17835.1 hypothetical protein GCM10007938_16130 [Vibrio zhanjiangensis]
MAREIFTKIGIEEITSLQNTKIISADELSTLTHIEESKTNGQNEIEKLLDEARQEAKKIIESALSEKQAIINKAQNQALSVQKLDECSLENKQRAYWKNSISSLEQQIENIVSDILSNIIHDCDRKDLIRSLIRQGLEFLDLSQSICVRVPMNLKHQMSESFPDLIIEGEEDLIDALEIESDNEVYLLSIDNVRPLLCSKKSQQTQSYHEPNMSEIDATY